MGLILNPLLSCCSGLTALTLLSSADDSNSRCVDDEMQRKKEKQKEKALKAPASLDAELTAAEFRSGLKLGGNSASREKPGGHARVASSRLKLPELNRRRSRLERGGVPPQRCSLFYEFLLLLSSSLLYLCSKETALTCLLPESS